MNILAIINITNNSLGIKKNKNNIIFYIKKLIQYKITAIDIGAQATNPLNPRQLLDKEEKKRLNKNLLKKIIKICHKNNILVSIDTYRIYIMKYIIKENIDIINDIQGFNSNEKINLLLKSKKTGIVMHNIATVASLSNFMSTKDDVTTDIYHWCINKKQELINSGIESDQIILDIGIGAYGKNNTQSWNLLKSIDLIRKINTKLLVGHSYKGFIREIGDKDNITIIVSIYLKEKNIDFIRVHNIEYHRKFIKYNY
ncbi:MAG: dihydropteroate synthase [Anaplasmataceae bacterium]|nr:dihydropteroate synthase [Anaplasmataceae bacterium]